MKDIAGDLVSCGVGKTQNNFLSDRPLPHVRKQRAMCFQYVIIHTMSHCAREIQAFPVLATAIVKTTMKSSRKVDLK